MQECNTKVHAVGLYSLEILSEQVAEGTSAVLSARLPKSVRGIPAPRFLKNIQHLFVTTPEVSFFRYCLLDDASNLQTHL